MPPDPVEVERLYHEVAAWPQDRQRPYVSRLEPELRGALWSFHLRRFVDRHPELNAEQRTVLEESLELLATPGFFFQGIRPRDAAMEARWQVHKARATAAFTPPFIYALFYRFGDEIPTSDDFGVAQPFVP